MLKYIKYCILYSILYSILYNILYGIHTVQYTVQNTVQYTVEYTVQYTLQYTVQYTVEYTVEYTLQYTYRFFCLARPRCVSRARRPEAPKPYAQYDLETQRRPNLTHNMIRDQQAPKSLVFVLFFAFLQACLPLWPCMYLQYSKGIFFS